MERKAFDYHDMRENDTLEQIKAAKGAKEGNDLDSEPMGMYLENNFKSYVEEKYELDDPELIQNETLLQMIYALEWFDIPRSAKTDLIEFHPYLTVKDHAKLFYIKEQHMIELGVSGLFFSLVCNRILHNQGPSFFKKRYVRFPTALLGGAGLTFTTNRLFLKKLLDKDLKEEALDRYYQLDLNADMMKQDLAQMGIKITANHFDMDATQKRINEVASQAYKKL